MRIFLLLLFLLTNLCVFSQKAFVTWDTLRMKLNNNWEKEFTTYNTRGTLIIYDKQKNLYHIYDSSRFKQQYLPASTFKIIHTLIALETGVIKNVRDKFEWDGTRYDNEKWNKSQSVTEAYKNSTVWVYQQIAQKIGFKNMQEWIDKCNYGNKNITGGLTDFWLKGKLRISAIEQIEFLKKLQSNLLPFSDKHTKVLKEIMIEEKTTSYIIRSKTGWANYNDSEIGWYVGYVEKEKGEGKNKKKEYYFFALNLDIKETSHADARKYIVKRILSDLKII
jgi:beta-lactamase class D